MEGFKVSYRQAGRDRKGRLRKGLNSDSANRSNAPSIPTNYEVILTNQNLSSSKGFGSTSHRWKPEYSNYAEPGQYYSSRSVSTSASDSTRTTGRNGQTNFTNRARRFNPHAYATEGPGPAAYVAGQPRSHQPNYKSAFVDKPEKPMFPPNENPAPWDYSPVKQGKEKVIVSSFRNEAPIRQPEAVEANPAPCDYDPTAPVSTKSQVNASFKQPSYLRRYQVNLYDPHAPIELPKYPGPAQYNILKDSSAAPGQTNVLSTWMFSATDTDRFGGNINPKVAKRRPAPGDYEYSFREDEKYPVSGAVFMSETERKMINAIKKPPGPAYYNLKAKAKKKSFHLNTNKTWLYVVFDFLVNLSLITCQC